MRQELIHQNPEQKEKVLFLGYNNIEEEEKIISKAEIRRRLINLFRHHIGIDNSANPSEIFQYVFGVPARQFLIYERNYYWNIIKMTLKELRHEGELFVIHRGPKYFVLHDDKELGYYKKMNDRHIENLKNLKKIATDWIKKKKWMKI